MLGVAGVELALQVSVVCWCLFVVFTSSKAAEVDEVRWMGLTISLDYFFWRFKYDV